jgi:NADH dehydrogenase
MKKVVIIGAGYSGILTAKKLEKKLRKNADADITVLDKYPFHTMLTELHEVAAGRVDEPSIRINLRKVFAGRRIRFAHDRVQSVDFTEKTVVGELGRYAYDYLVIAAGSQPTYFGIKGAEENTWPLWSFDDAVRLKARILECFRKASAAPDEKHQRRLLSFVIVGAGFTGVEMAGELAEYVPVLCDMLELSPALVRMTILDALPRPVPNLPEALSDKIRRRLQKMGVEVRMNARVLEVGPEEIEIEESGGKTRINAGTVIWVAGIESAEITQEAGKTLSNQRRGRLETDGYLRSVDDKSVYIAGDNLFYVPAGEKDPVPQMVENCEQSADAVAHNIYCAMTGKDAPEHMELYKPKFHGVMVSIGGRYGVARVGSAKNMVSLPSFLAMFVKHFINIIYFAQVLGWNKIASYLKHEFFTIRNKRSFVGGHFSNRTPSFLAVPLRLWLGAVWLFEGIMKIVEGWFSTPRLDEFFNGARRWFDAIITGTGSAAAAVKSAAVAVSASGDAVAGATGGLADEGAAAGRLLLNLDFLGLIRFMFVSGKPPEAATLADYAFRLDIPIANWFVDNVVLQSGGMQIFMQVVIVLLEILIGLSLIGGLLTTPSSFGSLILLFLFSTTTGLYLSNLWMAFAAIAFLWGAGSVFGLDYYTTPWLNRKWRQVGWARKLYLYHN